MSLPPAPVSGAARAARERQKRALARKVLWITDLAQCRASHHTTGADSAGAPRVVDEVAALRRDVARLQADLANLRAERQAATAAPEAKEGKMAEASAVSDSQSERQHAAAVPVAAEGKRAEVKAEFEAQNTAAVPAAAEDKTAAVHAETVSQDTAAATVAVEGKTAEAKAESEGPNAAAAPVATEVKSADAKTEAQTERHRAAAVAGTTANGERLPAARMAAEAKRAAHLLAVIATQRLVKQLREANKQEEEAADALVHAEQAMDVDFSGEPP